MRGRSQPFRWRRRNATNGANAPTGRADIMLFWVQDRDGIAAAVWDRRTLVDALRPHALARRAPKQPGHFFLERNDAVLRRTVGRTFKDGTPDGPRRSRRSRGLRRG